MNIRLSSNCLTNVNGVPPRFCFWPTFVNVDDTHIRHYADDTVVYSCEPALTEVLHSKLNKLTLVLNIHKPKLILFLIQVKKQQSYTTKVQWQIHFAGKLTKSWIMFQGNVFF